VCVCVCVCVHVCSGGGSGSVQSRVHTTQTSSLCLQTTSHGIHVSVVVPTAHVGTVVLTGFLSKTTVSVTSQQHLSHTCTFL